MSNEQARRSQLLILHVVHDMKKQNVQMIFTNVTECKIFIFCSIYSMFSIQFPFSSDWNLYMYVYVFYWIWQYQSKCRPQIDFEDIYKMAFSEKTQQYFWNRNYSIYSSVCAAQETKQKNVVNKENFSSVLYTTVCEHFPCLYVITFFFKVQRCL